MRCLAELTLCGVNNGFFQALLGNDLGLAAWTLLKIVAIVLPLLGCVAYLTLAERKVIGYMQCPYRPKPCWAEGLLQPIADALKLLTKEIIMPTKSSKFLFILAPVIIDFASTGGMGR